jgi:Domain of unknown function (DUF5658)
MGSVDVETSPHQLRSGNQAAAAPTRRFSREGRILGVLIAIAVMAYADLDMTLAYATSVGMAEANPVARAVMGFNSPAMVVGYKIVCTLTGLVILYRLRRCRCSEPAAWAMLLVMGWLMLRWTSYNQGISETSDLLVDAAQVQSDNPDWIIMTP